MVGTARATGREYEAFDWLVDLDTLLCSDVSYQQGLHWIPVNSFLFELAVYYNGPVYLGCILRRRNEKVWKAVPFTTASPAEVTFSGSMIEAMSWIEDHANAR